MPATAENLLRLLLILSIVFIYIALDAQRPEGKSPLEATYDRCIVRFRPIMMTTLAALLGGLLISQLIALYLTPIVYLYLDALQTKLSVRTPTRA